MSTQKNTLAILAMVFVVIALVGRSDGNLEVGFYNGKCGSTDIEQFIFNVVKNMMKASSPGPGLVGDLTRLSFHDCFVRGCDASILIDGPTAERQAKENLNLDGFDDIASIKQQVEAVCPGVVSCADILVLATRDTINIAGGNRYIVGTGRRDSLISRASDAANVPSANILMSDAIREFYNIGLDVEDLVILLGAHTVGVVHCNNFQDRLYNYLGTGKPDPTMDPALVQTLQKTCPANQSGNETTTFLDRTPNSGDKFDLGYYNQILVSRGVTKIDQRLATDPATRDLVRSLSHGPYFFDKFGPAMIKMTSIGVLTGTQGEIRRHCNVTNS